MYPQQIIEALRTVRYPGTGKDIIASGMLEDDIRISGFAVSFSLIFPKENDPFRKSLIRAAETAIKTYVDENAEVTIHEKFTREYSSSGSGQEAEEQKGIRASHIIAVSSGKG